jgi:hypothetical protein
MPRPRCLACVVLVTLSGPVVADERPFPELLADAQARSRDDKWPEAATLWRQVVARNPTRGEYWTQLGTALVRQKEYGPAAEAYRKAFELRSGYPANAAYNAACCYALGGEKDAALKWLEAALTRGYRNLTNAQTDDDLKTLRDDPRYRELVLLADTKAMSRDEGWRHDLKVAAREIKRLHYNPFREVTREQFDAYVRRLHDDIPKLTDDQVMVGLVKLARMAGDGHTHLRPGGIIPVLPVQLFLFEEGVFVTSAAPEQADLAGAQVLKVGGRPTTGVLKALDPVISRDNPMGPKALGPNLLRVPRLLQGLGLTPDAEGVPLTVRLADGTERDVTLKPVPGFTPHTFRDVAGWATARKGADRPDPLYLKNRNAAYWFENLPEHKLVYFQYNAVRNDGKETLEQFCDRLFKFVEANDVEKLVVDLRWNGGGNSFLNKPVVHGLIRCGKVNRDGRLFVVTGRNTFSAAQNCATDIEMHTKAIFVGEPTGASPNFIGESIPITLPYSKMTGSISDLYWQRSWPMDYRPWIAPLLYAPPTFAFYKANRDPALEAILAYVPKEGRP